MKEKYNVDDHAQHIFENDLDGFFNYLATECDLYYVLVDAFNVACQFFNSSNVGVIIRSNEWKKFVFDLLNSDNEILWNDLTEYAQKLHDSAQEEFEIERYEQ